MGPRRLLFLVVCWTGASGCADGAGDESLLEIATPVLEDIAPGADALLCTYLEDRVAADADVIGYTGSQSAFGHHAILFEARAPMEEGTRPCGEADLVNLRHVATIGGAGEGAGFELPEGVTFRIHEGHQLMVLTHWVNSSDVPIDGRVTFQLTLSDPSPDRVPAALFTVFTTRIDVPAGPGEARAECTLARDVGLAAFEGHAHDHATQVTIRRNDAVLYDEVWKEGYALAPPIIQQVAGAPVSLHTGDQITVACQYQNETAGSLQFPEEMCAMLGFYFPADGELGCVNGLWYALRQGPE